MAALGPVNRERRWSVIVSTMEYSPVHEVVAKWIASLPNISHANRENLAIYIASRGLTVLKGK